MELKNIIEKGVNKLEEIADVKWQNNCYKLSREKFIIAIERYYIEDISIAKAAGYSNESGFSEAMRKIAKNIQDRPSSVYWHTYILKLAGYKQCCSCREIKELHEFPNNIGRTDNKGSTCSICISDKAVNNKKEIVLKIIDIMKEDNKLLECFICGYKENWAALDFHHINPEIKRPKWAYDKNNKKRTPSSYLFSCAVNTAITRYTVEKDNLELLCANCHQKHHYTGIIDTKSGVKETLKYLHIEYRCQYRHCMEENNLHLHHNNPIEKSISFSSLNNQTSSRIITDKLLEKEMKKDVIILCANHHREIHNLTWKINNL